MISLKNRVAEEIVDIAPCTMAIIREFGGFRAVVGSGVSVCLYDRRSRVAGMNHYLLPRVDDPREATGRYGNASLLGILALFKRHAPAGEPVAYIAGGAYCDEFEIDSALENIRIAWRFLLIKEIPIISQYLGGRRAREVFFDASAGIFTASFVTMQ
jgi:chemotaxis protein CheD